MDRIWYRSRNTIFNLKTFNAGKKRAQGATFYDFDDDWNLIQVTSASEVHLSGTQWKLFKGGITLFDTARGYSDSEEKLGYALADVRDEIVITTKSSGAKCKDDVLQKVEQSLTNLRTDHVDVLQLHNPRPLPDPEAMVAIPPPFASTTVVAQRVVRRIAPTNRSGECENEFMSFSPVRVGRRVTGKCPCHSQWCPGSDRDRSRRSSTS